MIVIAGLGHQHHRIRDGQRCPRRDCDGVLLVLLEQDDVVEDNVIFDGQRGAGRHFERGVRVVLGRRILVVRAAVNSRKGEGAARLRHCPVTRDPCLADDHDRAAVLHAAERTAAGERAEGLLRRGGGKSVICIISCNAVKVHDRICRRGEKRQSAECEQQSKQQGYESFHAGFLRVRKIFHL